MIKFLNTSSDKPKQELILMKSHFVSKGTDSQEVIGYSRNYGDYTDVTSKNRIKKKMGVYIKILGILLGLMMNMSGLFSEITSIDELIGKIQPPSQSYFQLREKLDSLIRTKEIWLEDSIHRILESKYFESIYEISLPNDRIYGIVVLGREKIIRLNTYLFNYKERDYGYLRKYKKEARTISRKTNKKFKSAMNFRLGRNPLKVFIPNTSKGIIVFGMICGRSASATPIARRMLRLVKNKNKLLLNSWGKSEIPEIRLAGILGLEMLKRQGFQIGRRNEKLINNVSQEKTAVNTCYGCTGFGLNYSIEDSFEEFQGDIDKYLRRYIVES